MNLPNLMARKAEFVYEYDTLRVVLTLMVIVGHSAYYTILTGYGGVDYLTVMRNHGICDAYFHQMVFERITGMIYLFHMPMFMALSGAVFFTGYNKGKYREFFAFAANKARRLLLPFIIATLFWDVPLKYFGGYYDKSTDIFTDIIMGQVLLQGSNHLWFLVVLFLEMIIFQRLLNSNMWGKYHVVIIASIVAFYGYVKTHPIFALANLVVEYMLWFLVGIEFERFRNSINSIVGFKSFITIASMYLGCFFSLCLAWCPQKLVMCTVFLSIITGMMTTYIICLYITEHKIGNMIINKLSKWSFGIYLFSDPLNYVLLACFIALVGINGFGYNSYSTGLYGFRIIVQIVTGILVTILVRRLGLFKI